MHFFISYAQAETKDFAQEIRATIQQLSGDYTAWMDEALTPGKNWDEQIQEEIDRCDYMIVLLSPDVNRSGGSRSFVLREIHYARSKNKPIITLMVQMTNLPLILAGDQYLDCSKDKTGGIKRLKSYILSLSVASKFADEHLGKYGLIVGGIETENIDKATFKSNLEKLLLSMDFLVDVVDSGKDGIDAIARRNPDITIVSEFLTDMSGLSFCKRVTHLSKHPVIMMANQFDMNKLYDVFQAGIDDLVWVPYRRNELVARIQGAMRRYSLDKMSPSDQLGTKVLVLEDESYSASFLGEILEFGGYDPVVLSDPREALPTAYRTQPDVFLLDIMMPIMNGFEVCSQLRMFTDAPIIFLTALSESEDVVRGFEVGGDDYITKPFKLKTVLFRIRTVIERHNLRNN